MPIHIAERADAGYGNADLRQLEIDATSLPGSIFLTLGDTCVELHKDAFLAAVETEVSADTGAMDLRSLFA